MTIVIFPPGPLNAVQRTHYYFSDPETGWCGPLRADRLTAVMDAQRHAEVKAATRDEQR